MMRRAFYRCALQPYSPRRRAVALLVTLLFIIAISAAVGISLMQLRQGNDEIAGGRFLVQSSVMVEDLLLVLADVEKIAKISDAASLRQFLESTTLLPLSAEGVEVRISLHSEMGKLNINTLSRSQKFQEALINHMRYGYNVQEPLYMSELLMDCMDGEKEAYRTDIFEYLPELYRERIADAEHFKQLIDYYVQTRHDDSVRDLPWEELIRFDEHNSTRLDANYVSAELWQMLLPGVGPEMAAELAGHPFAYEKGEDLGLSGDYMTQLGDFNLSYYEPVVHVGMQITENNQSADIAFDYDLGTKKAKEFSYDI